MAGFVKLSHFLVKAVMDEQDELLQQLITVVTQYPNGSREWRKAMYHLLSSIQTLPGLARRAHPDYPEVLNVTLDSVSQNIWEFQPRSSSLTKDFVNWINYRLRHKYRVLELNQNASSKLISIDSPVSTKPGSKTFADRLADPRPSNIWELEAEIEQWQQQQTTESIGRRLRQYIEQDPEGKLRSCASRRYPKCNGHLLSQRKYLQNPPDNLAKFAREFEIPYITVVKHWTNRALPLLQTIALEFGYNPTETYD